MTAAHDSHSHERLSEAVHGRILLLVVSILPL